MRKDGGSRRAVDVVVQALCLLGFACNVSMPLRRLLSRDMRKDEQMGPAAEFDSGLGFR